MMRKSILARWAKPNATLNTRSALLSSAPVSLAPVGRLTFPGHHQDFRRSGGCPAANNVVGVTEREPRAEQVVAPFPVAAIIESLTNRADSGNLRRSDSPSP
jgi:hypothetical protein